MLKTSPVSRKAQRGFTLMEVLITLAVLAVIAAIALPNFTKAKSGVGEGMVAPRLKNIAAAEASFRSTLRKNRYAPLSELRTTTVDGVPLIAPTLISESGGALAFDGWILSEPEDAGQTTFGIVAMPATTSNQGGGDDSDTIVKGGKLGGPGGIVKVDCSVTAYCVFEDGVVRKGTACGCTRESQPVDGPAPTAGKPVDFGPPPMIEPN